MVPKLRLVLALIVAAAPTGVVDAVAQTSGRLGIVTTIDGAPMLSRDSLPDGRLLGFRDEIFVGDAIRTPAGALVRVLMAGRATLLSVAEQSAVHLGEDADALTVRVETGKVRVIVDGAAGATPRHTLIETDAALATFGGASVVAEIRGGTTTFVVLRGEAQIARRDGRAGSSLTLRAFEVVGVVGDAFGPVERLTAEAAAVALRDFRLGPSASRASQETTPDVVSRQLLEAEAEMQRRGMTRVPDPQTSADGSSSMPSQLHAPVGSSRAVVSPQALIPPTLGTPFRGQDLGPGKPVSRVQSP
jgi:hypothetical protein